MCKIYVPRWSLNVWESVIGNHVTGPYFFDQRVTGVYLLQNHLNNLVAEVPNETQEMRFLHDETQSII